MDIRRRLALPLAVALALTGSAIAADEAGFTITPLNDHLYKLTAEVGYPVNLLVSVGDDGILLVDTGVEKTAEALVAAVNSIRDETPRIIINTHCHVEHLGGNAIFGPEPVIIAHARTRAHMLSDRWLVMEYPEHALPEVTFDAPMSIFFNGEEIRLTPLIGAHCDDDVIVHFTESAVACTSGIVNGDHFPSVDTELGDVMLYPAAIKELIELLPEGVKIICPHGADRTTADLLPYHDMIVETMEIVRAGLDAGKDVATLQAENVLEAWKGWEASYVSTDQWIEYLAEGLRPTPTPTLIMGPLYRKIKEEGVDAAIAFYRAMKAQRADEFAFSDGQLVFIARQLARYDRPLDAVAINELAIAEFPDSPYRAGVHTALGALLREQGETKRAIEHYREALELEPDDAEAAAALAELTEG